MNITLYESTVSGHAHRVRLFLSLLNLEYKSIVIDMQKGGHKTTNYLRLSPLGQVPTLIDGDVVITDSCAALVYLAKKYGNEQWLPEDAAGSARIQRWLSTASGELFRGPVVARGVKLFGRDYNYDDSVMWSGRLLTWMQEELTKNTWLAAEHVTIADIAMYSYLRVANEGDIDLAPFPAILRWLGDVENIDGFVPMYISC